MSTEPTTLMDCTGCDLHAKRYGSRWVYWPLRSRTGAVHTQPSFDHVRALACTDFAPDYSALFDARGALDAPETIPTGSVRSSGFPALPNGARELTLLVGHTYRDRCWS